MIELRNLEDLLPGPKQPRPARDEKGVPKGIRCYIEYLNAEAARLQVPIMITAFLDPRDTTKTRIELDYDGPTPEVVRKNTAQALFIKATTMDSYEGALQYLRGLAVMIFMSFLTAQVHKEEQEGSRDGEARQV